MLRMLVKSRDSVIALLLCLPAMTACSSDQVVPTAALLPASEASGPGSSPSFAMMSLGPGTRPATALRSANFGPSSQRCDLGAAGCAWAEIEFTYSYPWDLWAGTDVHNAVIGAAAMNGEAHITRGGSWIPGLALLSCGSVEVMGSFGCQDWDDFANTCHSESNSVAMNTWHVIVSEDTGIWHSGVLDVSHGCTCESGGGGGGGGGGGEEPELRSANSCEGGGGGGGGGGGPELVCHSEWMLIEISYDGGATWQTFWEGWGEVCEWEWAE